MTLVVLSDDIMKIAVHQPQYLPWIGYFDKIDQSDIFVILDDVQYKKNEWQNRNKIRNARGWQWVTVPVSYKFGCSIKDVKIDNKRDWKQKHLRSIELNYSHAEFLPEYAPFLKDMFSREWEYLSEVSIFFIESIIDILGIKTEVIKSSSLGIETSSTEKLVDICKETGGDVYLSGIGGKDYLNESMFAENNIELEFQMYEHPEYDQAFKGFFPYMSVIDLVLCKGDDSLNIIRGGRV